MGKKLINPIVLNPIVLKQPN